MYTKTQKYIYMYIFMYISTHSWVGERLVAHRVLKTLVDPAWTTPKCLASPVANEKRLGGGDQFIWKMLV